MTSNPSEITREAEEKKKKEITVYTIPVPAHTMMVFLRKLYAKDLPTDCDLELTDIEPDHKVGRLIARCHILAIPKVKKEEPKGESKSAPSEVQEVAASPPDTKTQ